MKIPFFSFEEQSKMLKLEINEAFNTVFESNSYILGKELTLFENSYSIFNKVKYTIGTGNGLDALVIALKALGIGAQDEVIVPSNTFIATWLAVSYSGATIIPVEPNILTQNIDPQNVINSITSKTKVIIPVHMFGQACQMDSIMETAKKNNVFVIEDNAQAHGSSFNKQLTGSFGDINATSFYPTKNLGAYGDGGALTTNNSEIAKKAFMIRNYGSEEKYFNELLGQNSRLDELQAALLSVKLRYLNFWTKRRKEIAMFYSQELDGVGDLILPSIHTDADHVFHLYVIRSEIRKELAAFLEKLGISTAIHYPIPPHLQGAYKYLNYTKGDFPIAEKLAQSNLSLPLYPEMTEQQLLYVCNAIKKFYEENAHHY